MIGFIKYKCELLYPRIVVLEEDQGREGGRVQAAAAWQIMSPTVDSGSALLSCKGQKNLGGNRASSPSSASMAQDLQDIEVMHELCD